MSASTYESLGPGTSSWDRVDVTMEHISQGVRREPRSCPIALALQDAGWSEARVFSASVQLDPKTPQYDMSDRLFRRECAYRLGKRLRPFTLVIDHWRRMVLLAEEVDGAIQAPGTTRA